MTTKPLSAGEKRMKAYVQDVPNAAGEESPEERNARINRNWEEIKKARIFALKQRNAPGVKMLDQELVSGRGTDFPADADFEPDSDFVPDSDFGPDKVVASRKPASQGVVRASEPSMALIEQEADERGWEAERRKYIAKHGVLTPGKTQSQAISEASGRRDPAETRQGAEAQHAIDTGELIYGDSAFYNIAKPAAAIAGFAAGGPLGATGAEAAVRYIGIAYNVNAAIDKGMDPDQATALMIREMTKGGLIDGAFNFGIPIIGHWISKIPGLNRIADKLHAELQKRIPGPAAKPDLRDKKIAERAAEAGTPERAAAVEELAKRTPGGHIVTPGQARGDVGVTESAVAHAFPRPFAKQEDALRTGAEKMRQELVAPGSQPKQQQWGEQVARLTDETVEATKRRLRPVFQEADRLRVHVDFSDVADIARKALAEDAAVKGGGKLTVTEREHLRKIAQEVADNPWSSAKNTLDFLSVQKAIMRDINPGAEPSPFFSTVIGDLTREAGRRFDDAARSVPGGGAIVDKLKAAREDYRVMMDAAYNGAGKQVQKKGEHAAEDVGSYLWQNGKVTRIDELDELLGLAKREGVASPAAIDRMRRNATRGFLQEAVRDVESAAKFTEKLSDPKRRATWEALTRTPEGQALKNGMAVLEQAAQMATMRNVKNEVPFFKVGIGRATSGGLGISWVTGAFSPVLASAGLAIAGTMRLMATAYVHGDKGTINLIAKIVRANSTATAASAKALQELVPQLEEAAEKYKVADVFIDKVSEQLGSQSDEQLGPR